MSTPLEPRLHAELKAALDSGLASGKLLSEEQVRIHAGHFRQRFGPNVLRELDGEALLRLLHGREDKQSRSLAYWLEFKNDEEFSGNRFGGIGGGSAMKFGVYQRQADFAWMGGQPTAPQVLPLEQAIEIARRQRRELLAGCAELEKLDPSNPSDDSYAQLQKDIERVAPDLSRDGWAHKYWYLIYPDRLDDYHNPRYQRFHLFKLLQMPPDERGVLDGGAPRFNCAGRFVSAAQSLGVPINTLNTVLNERDGALHRYWRVGTKAGDSGESQWTVMRDGSFVSIGWREHLPDLSTVIGASKTVARNQIREWLSPNYPHNAGQATRKSGEVLNFASEIAENDLVLACDGQTVLGVARIRAPYEYDGNLAFPHKRQVEWLLIEPWHMPIAEGLRTTVFELGRHAQNLLELERRLQDRLSSSKSTATSAKVRASQTDFAMPLLDPFSSRIESILQRKGQVILYGPPGTGKTFKAIQTAKEIAARHAFRKGFASLAAEEKSEVMGESDKALVRLCTFHAGYGYEDFVEGLRPRTVGGQMVFEPRDGIFKQACAQARANPNKQYFLVIDEINRGDVPRIFGELITVIETDKRGTTVRLPLSNVAFEVPRNIFIIGTMNTADRSISLLDAALRRRFGFVELMPDSSTLGKRFAGKLPLAQWLDALNERLRKTLKRDARNLQIGHAYLLPQPPITSVAEFARILRDDIIPLVEEYCYDDFGSLRDILGSTIVDVEGARIQEELFSPNREEDLIQAIWFEEMELSPEKMEDPLSSGEASDLDEEADQSDETET